MLWYHKWNIYSHKANLFRKKSSPDRAYCI